MEWRCGEADRDRNSELLCSGCEEREWAVKCDGKR